jgi:hypothetical protein
MPALRKKYSLTAQIAEVKREIALRRGVYPGQVSAGKMREGEADMHIDIMQNVQETLEWLQTNEATVRAAVAKREGAK